jgi:DMSO reductase anchor subunit
VNPAFSVVLFTTIAGAAQGLVVALALATLAAIPMTLAFTSRSLMIAGVMLVIGLLASFGHLGRKERAWRAVLMWRTSWLSRECIVLPAFIGCVALWWLMLQLGASSVSMLLVALVALALAAVLWLCTAMIYACLRFIEEWAQPLTLVNFVLIGLSSGFVLASALAVSAGEGDLLRWSGPAALLFTVAAWIARSLSLRRNATLKHRSTLQSATGIHSPMLVQKSMGMSAGSFNTREFFHGRTLLVLRNVRTVFLLGAFVLPALLALAILLGAPLALWWLAVLSQAVGLQAERWFFFAQARHPQNLYYQVVS